MKKLFFALFVFLPFVAFAGTYDSLAGASQMIADSFDNIYTYLFDDVPSMFQRATAWFIVWAVKAKIYAQLELMKYSWTVAKIIISDLNIMSQITSQMSLLPVDVRQAFVDMRLFDGVNLLFHAFMTKFVMRFIS